MYKKLLIIAAVAIAATLTSCGNADSSQEVTLREETSVTETTDNYTTTITTTTASSTTPTEEEITITTPEETEPPADEDITTAPETTTTTGAITEKTTTAAATTTKRTAVTTKKATTTTKKTPAEKIPASTAYKNYKEKPTTLSTYNGEFPDVDTIVKQAASLLGTPYQWGNKGYRNIYNPLLRIVALPVADINRYGIDCSGLVYNTLTHLGYKTSGFMFFNPVPVDTVHWLSVNAGSTITYNGTASKIDLEKNGLHTTKYEYWERADGSTITPGSVVVGENLYGDNHAWIYIGEFADRKSVVEYLKAIGVPDHLINSKTVGDGKGSGGTHWRIESNGSDGVVINNLTHRETTEPLEYNVYAFRITPKNADLEIHTYNSDGKLAGASAVDKSSAVYGIYRDKDCKIKLCEMKIGADGKGKISLPQNTYYVKQLKSPTGYAADTSVKTVKSGTNKITLSYLTRDISVKLTSEDGVVSGSEFVLSWTDNGKSHSQSAKADKNGSLTFSGIKVYDMSTGKAIKYTVSMNNSDTDKYETPADQSATLTKGNAELKFSRKLAQVKQEQPDVSGGDSSDVPDTGDESPEPDVSEPDGPDKEPPADDGAHDDSAEPESTYDSSAE